MFICIDRSEKIKISNYYGAAANFKTKKISKDRLQI